MTLDLGAGFTSIEQCGKPYSNTYHMYDLMSFRNCRIDRDENFPSTDNVLFPAILWVVPRRPLILCVKIRASINRSRRSRKSWIQPIALGAKKALTGYLGERQATGTNGTRPLANREGSERLPFVLSKIKAKRQLLVKKLKPDALEAALWKSGQSDYVRRSTGYDHSYSSSQFLSMST